MTVTLGKIARTHRESALELMVSAFLGDPLFLAMFGQDEHKARAVLEFMFDMNTLLDGEMLGAFDRGVLVGCALMDRPQQPPSLRYATRLTMALLRFVPLALTLGAGKLATLNKYMVETRKGPACGRYAYLAMVGVDPGRQGRGIGRRLVEAAVAQAAAWNADGLALDTENPANIRLYEKLGFISGPTLDLGAFTSFCMYRVIEP